MNFSAGLGDIVLAANAVLLVFHSIASYGLDGFAHAAEALVGEAVGARSPRRLRSVVLVSSLWAGVLSIILSAGMFLTGPALIDILTDIEAVRHTARIYLPWVAVLPMLSVASYQLDGIFIGATRTAEMRNAMVVALLGFVLLGTWLGGAMGNHGLWLAYAVFMVLRAAGLAAYYRRIERRL
jgi:MATE family multidrug resistance protein